MPKALVLLSGGLDSLVTLAVALADKRQVFAQSFGYVQRHSKEELRAAKSISDYYQIFQEHLS